jgi:NADH:ubiquinone oxidoreductase subunit H
LILKFIEECRGVLDEHFLLLGRQLVVPYSGPKGDLVNELLGRPCMIAIRDAPTYRLKANCALRQHCRALRIILEQSGSFLDWFVFRQPLGFLIFFIAAAAEGSRTPFDLTEADSEIVAGFATEYSGMRFGFFFFAEYVALFIMSTILVTLFLGGWLAPWPFPAQLNGFWEVPYGIFWFFLKSYFFVFVAVWARTTLPRVRIDQLMSMSWKVLLPLALVNLFVTAGIVLAFNL